MQGPLEHVYKAALSLGVANQLTNILRDVGEDSLERDRWAALGSRSSSRLQASHRGMPATGCTCLWTSSNSTACRSRRCAQACFALPVVCQRGGAAPAPHSGPELICQRKALLQVLRGMFCRHTGKIDDRWVAFMDFQIKRARQYFSDAQDGVNLLDENARWPVWSALILYRSACLILHICTPDSAHVPSGTGRGRQGNKGGGCTLARLVFAHTLQVCPPDEGDHSNDLQSSGLGTIQQPEAGNLCQGLAKACSTACLTACLKQGAATALDPALAQPEPCACPEVLSSTGH